MADDNVQEQLLETMEVCEPYSARDLADETGIPRRTVDHHLRKLADSGEIERKRHAENRVTWYRTGERSDSE